MEARSDFLRNQDLLEKVLQMLPIKKIITCRSVCRQWNDLIVSREFIQGHLRKAISASQGHESLVILRKLQGEIEYSLIDGGQQVEEDRVALEADYDEFDVAGADFGLVCLAYNKDVVLWNPHIRKSRTLPKFMQHLAQAWEFLGVGFDSRSHDYKVFKLAKLDVSEPNVYIAQLYSLQSNSWKNIDISRLRGWLLHAANEVGFCYSCNNVHFFGRRVGSTTIIAFDMVKEEFISFMLPEDFKKIDLLELTLAPYRGGSSIAVVRREVDRLEIWAMEKYGDDSSWTKYYKIRDRRFSMDVVYLSKNGQIIIDRSKWDYEHLEQVPEDEDLEVQEEEFEQEDGLIKLDPMLHEYEYIKEWDEQSYDDIVIGTTLPTLVGIDW